ncbi:elicitor-responsive protein 1-like [Olea europaea var. sylvestris]|uniref:Elicitor-responsive 1-like n=1 Tax=Olea europaea subsp. europaea TaxID=158383 RepID=A0A8S0V1T0_OLEEU|nr:elicitor-responsive protein 1-like [Olea europaea var. sylvestris]CAA3024833.1 elicitor-responsive 1-like [Olea europaea subsp. europaea]
MAIGIMEVKLMGAKGLKRSDFLGRIDPYVLLQYRNQEYKSRIAKGQGRNPIWNEKFKYIVDYPVDDDQYKLVLKIMDHDMYNPDDYLGEAKIYVKELIELGVEKGKAKLHPQKHRVVYTNLTYRGEIQVGITFTVKKETVEEGIFRKSSRRYLDDEERTTKRIRLW